jgi:ABC-type histidine transport system ATPase subunit
MLLVIETAEPEQFFNRPQSERARQFLQRFERE